MINEVMLEGNTSLLRFDARTNQLAALNLTGATALERTDFMTNPITCIQVANQSIADNYNANPGIYQKDSGATFGINCIFDIEISLDPQLLDVNGFYVINNGGEPPILSFDALDSGGMQALPAELVNYDLIITTLESTVLNPATGGPAPLILGDGNDFTLITDQGITIPVLNPGIDDDFTVDINGDQLFEADEFFVIEISTTDPSIDLLNADLDGVVRFNMRIDDINDTATASLMKVQDGVEGLQDIQYRISMTEINDTRQDLVFDINIADIDTDLGDYTNVIQATIPDGADEVIFSIPVTADALAEPLESLQTTLSYTGPFANRLTVIQSGPIVATITDNTQCTEVIFTDDDLRAFFADPASSSRIFDQFNNEITDLAINGVVCAERALDVYRIDLNNGYEGREITSLGGLEAFSNLEVLDMFSANFSGDINLTLYPSLVQFEADDNNINTVTTSPVNVNLRKISVVSQGTNDDTLTAVNINGIMPLLDNLVIQDNRNITSIDLVNVPKLEFFFSSGTSITRLDFTALETAGSDNFSISEIGGGGTLTEIDIRNNNASFNLADFFLDARRHPNLACVLVNTGADLAQTEQNIMNSVWQFDDDTVVKTDCDTPPIATIQATDPLASEVGPDDGQFTITLSSPVPQGCCPLTINYTVGGTALSGEDYTALTETIEIPIGDNSVTIDVDVLDNDNANDTETVVVTLEAGSGYMVGTPTSDTVTITNSTENTDAPVATITANDPDASEVEPDDGQFTITLSEPVPAGCCPLTINYTVGGTAQSGVDYTAFMETVQIPIGDNSVTIDVDVLDNDNTNDTETVVVTLEAGNGYTVGTPGSDTVTITNSGDGGFISSEDILVTVISETCEGQNNGQILVSVSNQDYIFNVSLNGDTIGQASFDSPLTIDNQGNGEFIVCLTTSDLPEFEQCFGVNINTFERLNVSSSALDTINLTTSYLVEGSKSYEVLVNGSLYKFSFNSTSERAIKVPLDSAENDIIITGISDCQGIFKESINLYENIRVFPNPVANNLNLLGVSSMENMKIELFSLAGQRIKSFDIQNNASNTINLPVFDLQNGVYLLRGQTNNGSKFELKIVKQ
jgi:hypothetical protein